MEGVPVRAVIAPLAADFIRPCLVLSWPLGLAPEGGAGTPVAAKPIELDWSSTRAMFRPHTGESGGLLTEVASSLLKVRPTAVWLGDAGAWSRKHEPAVHPMLEAGVVPLVVTTYGVAALPRPVPVGSTGVWNLYGKAEVAALVPSFRVAPVFVPTLAPGR